MTHALLSSRRMPGVLLAVSLVLAFLAFVVGARAWQRVADQPPRRLFAQILADADPTEESPEIWPDYFDALVPVNIAPLNFEIQTEGERFLTRLASPNLNALLPGKVVQCPVDVWKRLTNDAKDGQINVDVYVQRQNQWRRLQTRRFYISGTPITPWLTYRLLEPGYERFNQIEIQQRCLENFEEHTLTHARAINERTCVNCHTFQNYNSDVFLLHARRACDGTYIRYNGSSSKVSLRAPDSNLGCAYASWRAQGAEIAFSANATFQLFHDVDPDRIDVLDTASDLALYNAQTQKLRAITQTDDLFETFPSWSHDGQTLYYCVARNPYATPSRAPDAQQKRRVEALQVAREFHYNLARMSYDPETGDFGAPETLLDAEALEKSVAHPRECPNGSCVVYTLSDYGTFPIWRRGADLWELNLETGESRSIEEINSDQTESWHEWDKSGEWLVFSSRRDDHTYTRPYFAHRDPITGQWSKPFLLPQRRPSDNLARMKAYNLPVFTETMTTTTPYNVAKTLRLPLTNQETKR
ncbi:MAG: hypothetical protein Q4G03_01715 [Planctomycetia bacterium]|nr:hypothetical protein [Planctomycetia bacterium]